MSPLALKSLHPKTKSVRMRPRRSSGAGEGRIVVLVNGLFIVWHYMAPLAWRLAREGYDVRLYDYPTRRCGILEHGEGFALHLEELARETELAGTRIDIVTHSLGGILARVALSLISEDSKQETSSRIFPGIEPGRIGRVDMLAPPNKGSRTARLVVKALPWVGSFAKPLPELSCEPGSGIHSLPVPDGFEIGIISGTSDIHVSASQAGLETANDSRTLSSDHTMMPFYPHVYRELLHYLGNGRFL